MKAGYLFSLLFIAGGIIGILIVRSFFLDPYQVLGWQMFWNGLAPGKVMVDIKEVIKSATFVKCLFGFIIGGVAAGFVGIKIQKNISKETMV